MVISTLATYRAAIEAHLRRILNQLTKDATRLAIGEAWGIEKSWYPPNAFHTYWTLKILSDFERRFPEQFDQLVKRLRGTRFAIQRVRAEFLLWSKETASYQMTLHASDSSTHDSDQLAWALITILSFDRDFEANLAQQDFLRYGLKCLFAKQTNAGIWRTGAPLFHYKESGNAHCYVFETFSHLLRSVITERKEGVFLRKIFLPYVNHLLKLWHYAKSTQIPLSGDDNLFGWSSGHRANRKDAESWATASVFDFSQGLRCLIGIWAREKACEELKVSSGVAASVSAVEKLAERGDTWSNGSQTVATQLMTLFVNPVRLFGSGNRLEPDGRPIQEDQARGAILFGPPGTSKTTLARSVADAIGWDYVELHASHFVAEGLPNVQRTANQIFEKLLQLDRTVILFDEIDELVRAREVEPDAFGRFLTTSMLPKLAQLWERRKVIYFIATNYIEFFDPAVIRAQRFDALIHVSPPSLQRKRWRLRELLLRSFKTVRFGKLTTEQIEEAITAAATFSENLETGTRSRELPTKHVLAKLLLMRWDQLPELASIITTLQRPAKTLVVTRPILEAALQVVSDPSLRGCRPYTEYINSRRYVQRDTLKSSVWQIHGRVPGKYRSSFQERPDSMWYVSRAPFTNLDNFPCSYNIKAPGFVECKV
ncbi:MAG TPA: ATP-binding protein [Verrucomicrobiae bacterium]|nr:ATP-binding protein [Verrucomicrobiae bacterium]